MNKGSFGLNRTGHGGSSRDSNAVMADGYFCAYMKSPFAQLMQEEDNRTLQSWKDAHDGAQDAICDVEVIQQFASWLCNYARRPITHEVLKLGTILDILSSTKRIFNSLFPTNTIFMGNTEQVWYTLLRAKSKQEITRRDIKRGVSSSNKSKPVGRVQMRSVIETLITINSTASLRKAVYTGTTFNSAGRSGEVAYMCFDSGCYWDYDDEKLYFSQKEMKVGEEKNNNFVSDAETYVTDQYWLFSIYYILGGGCTFQNSNNSHSHFVFPELYDKEIGSKGSTAAFMTTILKDLMPTADNESKVTSPLLWNSDVTATSMRRGSTRVMVRKVPMQAVVAKTGHDMKGSRESSVWEYIDGDDVLLGHGSAALSGWSRPLDPIYPPTLNRISFGVNVMKLSSLSSILFDHSPPITKIQNIKGFVDTMLATFLMHLEEFIDDCNNKYNKLNKKKNVILAIFEGKINGIFTLQECLQFGVCIKDEWEEKNGLQESTSDMKGLILSMERVQGECLKIRSENRDLRTEIKTLQEQAKNNNQILQNQNEKLLIITEMLTKLTVNKADSSPQSVTLSKKRFFDDLSYPAELNEDTRKSGGGQIFPKLLFSI